MSTKYLNALWASVPFRDRVAAVLDSKFSAQELKRIDDQVRADSTAGAETLRNRTLYHLRRLDRKGDLDALILEVVAELFDSGQFQSGIIALRDEHAPPKGSSLPAPKFADLELSTAPSSLPEPLDVSSSFENPVSLFDSKTEKQKENLERVRKMVDESKSSSDQTIPPRTKTP